MINKIKFLQTIFNKNLLKNSTIDKNKQKVFIIFSDNTKLNWLLFREIIVKAHYHFNISPILYITDSIGFTDVDSEKIELNPYNPTFNILSKVDCVLNNADFVHHDIKNIKYSIWWEQLADISEDRTNLLLFSDNRAELEAIVETTKNENTEIVIFLLEEKNRSKDYTALEIFQKEETWLLKYNPKILKYWTDLDLLTLINTKINIKKHKKLKRLRNKIFMLMNLYYKNSIIPSYYNDEEKFEKADSSAEKIKAIYE